MPTSAVPELAIAAARRFRPSAGAGDIRPLALYGARQSDWAYVDAVLEQYETS